MGGIGLTREEMSRRPLRLRTIPTTEHALYRSTMGMGKMRLMFGAAIFVMLMLAS